MTGQFSGGHLLERLDPQFQGLCRRLGNLAREADLPLYLVGGIVRDLMLGYVSMDFDFVVEGDAIGYAQFVHGRYGGEILIHPRFRTANWRPPDMALVDLDFVTARSESYAKPAALPDITPADLAADLFRRDFTINTMAIRLDGRHWGTFVDPYDGRRDLDDKILRVLHDQSFVDDPTRIWRGVRFEQRFDLSFDPHSAALLQQGRTWLKFVSGDRIRHEMLLLLAEAHPEATLCRLDDLGALAAVHGDFQWTDRVLGWWEGLEQRLGTPFLQRAEPEWTRPVWRLLLLLLAQPPAAAEQTAARLRLTVRQQETCRQAHLLRSAVVAGVFKQGEKTKISRVDAFLRPFAAFPGALPLVALSLANPEASHWGNWLENYLLEWQNVGVRTTGHTLRALGIPPGPRYREILEALRGAHLDGEIATPDEEADLLQRLLNNGR